MNSVARLRTVVFISAKVATLTLALAVSFVARAESPDRDRLLTAGEAGLTGSYTLDNVLVLPGKLVIIADGSIFAGLGETIVQAEKSGTLKPQQATTLGKQKCRLRILANHTFTVSGLPSANISSTVSILGKWRLTVYEALGTYGYRIELTSDAKSPELHARFLNADRPSPQGLEIFYGGKTVTAPLFRFVRTSKEPSADPASKQAFLWRKMPRSAWLNLAREPGNPNLAIVG